MITFLNNAINLGSRLIYNRRGGRGGDNRGTEIPSGIENPPTDDGLKALMAELNKDPKAQKIALNPIPGLFQGPNESNTERRDYFARLANKPNRSEEYFENEGGDIENQPQQKV